jgi:protein-tyrosine phosphatase
MSETTLQESMWWIIPGQLAGMRKPAADELEVLQAEGVGAIVSVMDDPSNLDLYEAAHIPHRWLPTTGGKAPTQEQVNEFCQFVDAQNQAANAVAVHCSSGRRRTATFLGAYLIRQGASYEAALAAIAQANPAVAMREPQRQFLHALAAEA